MNKRKLLAVLSSVTLIVLCIWSFSRGGSKKYKVNTAYIHQEIFWEDRDGVDLDAYTAPDEATVTLNGITYTGRYFEKEVPYWHRNAVLYHYQGENFTFSLWESDGQLYEFENVMCSQVKECKYNEESNRKTADEIARQFLTLEAYQCEATISKENTDSHDYHEYHYYRVIDGCEANGYLTIRFDCIGQLHYIRRSQKLGYFENVKSVKINEEKIKKAVERRLSEWDKNFVRYEMRSEQYALAMTAEGQCAITFSVVPYCKDSDGTVRGYKILTMAVIVDYEKYD